eukprot:Platyproteum_vivax@DN6131_c1_g1_i1.p1
MPGVNKVDVNLNRKQTRGKRLDYRKIEAGIFDGDRYSESPQNTSRKRHRKSKGSRLKRYKGSRRYKKKCSDSSEDSSLSATGTSTQESDSSDQPPPKKTYAKMLRIPCSCLSVTRAAAPKVACDGCGAWFHQSCAGLTRAQARSLPEWYCSRCEPLLEGYTQPFHGMAEEHPLFPGKSTLVPRPNFRLPPRLLLELETAATTLKADPDSPQASISQQKLQASNAQLLAAANPQLYLQKLQADEALQNSLRPRHLQNAPMNPAYNLQLQSDISRLGALSPIAKTALLHSALAAQSNSFRQNISTAGLSSSSFWGRKPASKVASTTSANASLAVDAINQATSLPAAVNIFEKQQYLMKLSEGQTGGSMLTSSTGAQQTYGNLSSRSMAERTYSDAGVRSTSTPHMGSYGMNNYTVNNLLKRQNSGSQYSSQPKILPSRFGSYDDVWSRSYQAQYRMPYANKMQYPMMYNQQQQALLLAAQYRQQQYSNYMQPQKLSTSQSATSPINQDYTTSAVTSAYQTPLNTDGSYNQMDSSNRQYYSTVNSTVNSGVDSSKMPQTDSLQRSVSDVQNSTAWGMAKSTEEHTDTTTNIPIKPYPVKPIQPKTNSLYSNPMARYSQNQYQYYPQYRGQINPYGYGQTPIYNSQNPTSQNFQNFQNLQNLGNLNLQTSQLKGVTGQNNGQNNGLQAPLVNQTQETGQQIGKQVQGSQMMGGGDGQRNAQMVVPSGQLGSVSASVQPSTSQMGVLDSQGTVIMPIHTTRQGQMNSSGLVNGTATEGLTANQQSLLYQTVVSPAVNSLNSKTIHNTDPNSLGNSGQPFVVPAAAQIVSGFSVGGDVSTVQDTAMLSQIPQIPQIPNTHQP